jgi:tetratricopeptide (TPR) repeat protein/tRNA A-37 threonylcarbamoyl transferase component Bud32
MDSASSERDEPMPTALGAATPVRIASMDTEPTHGPRPASTDAATADEIAVPEDPDATRCSPTTPEESPPANRRLGDYELLEEVARGGMGVVYKARHVKLNRIVALKMILGGRFASPGVMGRFQLEARAAAALNHPGIVPVYDVGEVEGQPYFTMAFVDGGSLQQLLAAGPLSSETAARVLLRIAEAVQCAHDKGIIHRDIKPQNILLRRPEVEGAPTDPTHERAALSPMLADFGLARAASEGSGMTRTGEAMGTPSFMPPEQARGDTKAVGPCSDVYSLGAVLYCTLTGRPPFCSTDAGVTMRQVLEDEPPPPRSLNPKAPRDLEAVCLKCLVKEPRGRYATVAQMAEDLRCFLEDRPLRHARPVTPSARAWRRAKRVVRHHPLGTASVLLVLAAIVGLAGWGVRAGRDAERSFTERVQAARDAGADAERAWKDGKRNEARDKFTSAQVKYAELVQQGPDRADLRIASARLDMRKSELLSQMRQLDGAENELKRARAELESLPAADQRRADARLALAEVFHLLAFLNETYAKRENRNRALVDYEQSRRIRQELCAEDPGNRKYRRDLARSYGYMGDTQLALGLEKQAWDSYQEAEKIRQELADDPGEGENPIVAKYQLARSFGNTGAFYDWQGKPELAIAHYLKRMEYVEGLHHAEVPAEFATDLPWCRVVIAQLQLDSRPDGETGKLLNQALQDYQKLLDDNPKDKDSIVSLAQVYVNLAKLAVLTGDTAKAVAILDQHAIDPLQELVLTRRLEQPSEYYLMAQALALKSQWSVGDPADQRKQAFGYLKAAIENGFCNLAQLERDTAFRPFHEREDYRECVRRIHRERAEPARR